MTFEDALKAIEADPSKMAVPTLTNGTPPDGGIIFVPQERPCWGWSHGGVVRLPAPKVLHGDWVVVDKEL